VKIQTRSSKFFEKDKPTRRGKKYKWSRSESYTGITLQKFHLYPNLPVEMRTQILKAAAIPRQICLHFKWFRNDGKQDGTRIALHWQTPVPEFLYSTTFWQDYVDLSPKKVRARARKKAKKLHLEELKFKMACMAGDSGPNRRKRRLVEVVEYNYWEKDVAKNDEILSKATGTTNTTTATGSTSKRTRGMLSGVEVTDHNEGRPLSKKRKKKHTSNITGSSTLEE
jgi:hypothetical protein